MFKVKFNRAWDEFRKFMDRKERRRSLDAEFRRSIREQLGLLRRDVLNYVDSEKHGVSNSPLTVLIKGSDKPLVDHGDLRQSFSIRTEKRSDGMIGGVGVLRTRRSRDGSKLWNVAVALHEGYVVKVNAKVRAAVFAEMRRRRGRKVKVEGTGSKNWKVKGRPYLKDPFEAAEGRIKVALGNAVRRTLHIE